MAGWIVDIDTRCNSVYQTTVTVRKANMLLALPCVFPVEDRGQCSLCLLLVRSVSFMRILMFGSIKASNLLLATQKESGTGMPY